MDASQLNPEQRQRALRRMVEQEFDVAIVGGGVTGCGAALDASSRGLSVALIEQRDYSSGTSSRSSKLIHGGLRYLEQLHFGLVREARHEQALLLTRLCPHLVQPIPFLFPLRHRIWERLYVGAGVALYDALAGRRVLPRHRHLSRAATLRAFPALRGDALVGGIQYFDARVDDARHTLTLARTAAAHDAALATSVRAVGFEMARGRVRAVRARCLESGAELEIRARQVINASGVWSERVGALAGGGGELRVRASKGIHLLVSRQRIEAHSGLILRTEKSVLFVIPWYEHWIIGTTDTSWDLDLDHPAASRADIDYLLAHVNAWLAKPLGHADIVGVYAGLRPLLYGESDSTSTLSREHAVSIADSGLISVAGGKYTTYRVMARDAVDAAVQSLGGGARACRTHLLPLLGAEGYPECRARCAQRARELGLREASVERLVDRYGSLANGLLEQIAQRRDLGAPLEGAPGYLRAELLYAATHEGALHLDDLLTRRTRISIETEDRGLKAAETVCELVAPTLGWDARARERELFHYRARVAAERESQQQLDDRTADAARLGAPDVRTSGRA
ncbi:MAG TPA: glycerol-3-phosphate dehydrogenase/oxidase [Myxococcota bacterium]|nr:glycerol-3-phosphate dehydrogenase/oxidase [Myxococcota bacterium]